MRKLCAGWMMTVSLACGVAVAQNAVAQNTQQPVQPGSTGQVRPGQAAPGQQTIQSGQIRQQTQPGQPQAVQPGQALQPNQQLTQRQGQPGQQGQGSRSDQEIAACVYGEASNEIEIAKLAQQKAQSDEVRQFAEQMVKDHSPGAQEMQQLAGNLASHNTPQRESDGGLDWVAVKNQIGKQCLASVKQELSQKPSAEFDHCFMGQQIAAHMKVVDELKVLRNFASQDLQQKLDKELQTAQQHLQLAKQIEKKLKDRPSERVSRRPDGSNK